MAILGREDSVKSGYTKPKICNHLSLILTIVWNQSVFLFLFLFQFCDRQKKIKMKISQELANLVEKNLHEKKIKKFQFFFPPKIDKISMGGKKKKTLIYRNQI
jgi:hypothetical protein